MGQPAASVASAGDGSAWLKRRARDLRAPLRRAALATAGSTLALVAQAWLLAAILSAALFQQAPLAALWRQWLLLLALAPLRWLLDVAARRGAHAAAVGLTQRLRAELLARAAALGPIGLRGLASGDLITRLVDGVDALLPYFARYLPQTASAVVVPLLLLAFVFPADWISGLILLLTAPLIPLFMVLVGGAAARASRDRFAQLTRLGAAFMDALGGLVTLRRLGAAERVANELAADGERYRRLTMRVLRVAFLSSLVLEFFAMVSIAMIAVLIGFRLLDQRLAFEQGLFVLLLAPEFYLPLRALGTLRHARMDAVAAAEQLAALGAHAAGAPTITGTAPAPAAAPEIALDAVHFAHTGRGPLLQGCTLRCAPGSITALVGASGAGKSTLFDLLLGFAPPAAGAIRIDGVDLSTLDGAAWRRRVAWVPQRPHVFEGSVRHNLLLACPGAGADALAAAARRSGLDAVIARLPAGWDTPLGEAGQGLSGGELQRLALARCFLRTTATLVLLDEPTAHLDADSAARIRAALRALTPRRTVLLIAHRLASAALADQVAVLQGGRVVECGAPAALARAGGAYARLLRAELT